MIAEPHGDRVRPRIPRGIWALGFVSMFMDISSEMIHALLPIYLVTTLAASPATLGLIEGIAEATASIVKVFSGPVSDWLGRRKILLIVGYGLATLSKPLFPLATSATMVLTARFVDRVGKGIRGAPRDALVGDLAPPEARGAAFGLRQSLDTVGAFCGPLLAIACMATFAGDMRLTFWIAVIPAALAVVVLLFGVSEPDRRDAASRTARPLRIRDVTRLGSAYWCVVAVATILTLARFSEAFLILRVQQVGLPATAAPLVLVVMNLAYGASAYPMGALADRTRPMTLLVSGFGVLVVADVILALCSGPLTAMIGIAVWGLHMGMTQGVLSALVADAAPADWRGTAFGIFNLAGGLALLAASVMAGWLWETFGAASTFAVGAAITVVALGISLPIMTRAHRIG